jgi:hypothetical protein
MNKIRQTIKNEIFDIIKFSFENPRVHDIDIFDDCIIIDNKFVIMPNRVKQESEEDVN